MIDLENRIERDELIDDYFNKGYACDIREVYQAIVNTIADLEYANDEKTKEIERLNYRIKRIAYQCYISDMSYDEFKHIWVTAMGKIYEPSQIDELEKELGVDKE